MSMGEPVGEEAEAKTGVGGGDGGKQEPKGKVEMAEEPYAMLLLAVGFLCFGAIVGGVTGASSRDGISNTLVTSLFTFVGGSLLGFGGFVRSVKGDVAYVSGRRIGVGLLTFSVGVGLGLWAGIALRLAHVPPTVAYVPPTVAPDKSKPEPLLPAPGAPPSSPQARADDKPKPEPLLHDVRLAACEIIQGRFATGAYEGDRMAPELRHDLNWFTKVTCPVQGPSR
jgi:hypothetical protein